MILKPKTDFCLILWFRLIACIIVIVGFVSFMVVLTIAH